MAPRGSLLFVDAYDSFSQNIVALLSHELAADVTLIHIDTKIECRFRVIVQQFIAQFDGVVLGPGPGNPNQAKDVGNLYDILDCAATLQVPVLGICLGFQILCVRYGLRIEPMKRPCHGHAKHILYHHAGPTPDESYDLFENINRDNVWATCYNSLGLTLNNTVFTPSTSRPGSSGTDASFCSTSSVASSPTESVIRVLATDGHRNVMAIRHKSQPFWGFQFHPESCRSNHGSRELVKQWWLAAQKERKRQLSPSPEQRSLLNGNPIGSAREPKAPSKNPSTSQPYSLSSIEIARQLLHISASTANIVRWRRIDAKQSRICVSNLVNDLAGSGDVLMLESTRKGRFSIYSILDGDFICNMNESSSMPPGTWQVQYVGSCLHIRTPMSQNEKDISATRADVWQAIEILLAKRKATGGPVDVPFWGGFTGYLSYEHGLDSIEVESTRSAQRSVPDISLVWVERSLIYDNLTNSVYIQSIRKNDEKFFDAMESLLLSSASSKSPFKQNPAQRQFDLQKALNESDIQLPDQTTYKEQFDQCQAELHAGNSYELCLTTESTITIPKPAPHTRYEFELYKNLHAHNPGPFGAFVKLSDITILGTSPEQYMSWSRDGVIDMIPMKGTVKRSADMTFARASSILSTPKESAENLMIADLIRHDLYNVVGAASDVEVVKLCEVVEHETVYQLVSHIRAHAPIDHGEPSDKKQELAMHYGIKALRETIPPGSMTGAPKKRSCEILSQLEQRNRGIYSGVLGYMDVGGGGNWSVCIRTAFRHNNESSPNDDDNNNNNNNNENENDVWHLGAGGAITVLSDAESEWQEMMVKLNSVLEGFKTVKNNIDI